MQLQTRKISDNQNLHTVAYLGLIDEAHSSGGSRFQKEFFGSGTEMRPSLSKSATDNNVYKCDNWWIDSEIKNTQLTEMNVKWVPGTHYTSMSLLWILNGVNAKLASVLILKELSPMVGSGHYW